MAAWSLSTWIDERVAVSRMRREIRALRRAAPVDDASRALWTCTEALWHARDHDGGMWVLLLAQITQAEMRLALTVLFVLHGAALAASERPEGAASALAHRLSLFAAAEAGAKAPGAGRSEVSEEVEAACVLGAALPPAHRRIIADVVQRALGGVASRERRVSDAVEAIETAGIGRTASKDVRAPTTGGLVRDAQAHYRSGLLFIGAVRLAAAAGVERAGLGTEEHLANAAGLLVHKAADAVACIGRAKGPDARSLVADVAWDGLRHAPDAFLFVARLQDASFYRLLAVPVAAAMGDLGDVIAGGASAGRSLRRCALLLRDMAGLSELRAVIDTVHAQLGGPSGVCGANDDDDGWLPAAPSASASAMHAHTKTALSQRSSQVGSALALMGASRGGFSVAAMNTAFGASQNAFNASSAAVHAPLSAPPCTGPLGMRGSILSSSLAPRGSFAALGASRGLPVLPAGDGAPRGGSSAAAPLRHAPSGSAAVRQSLDVLPGAPGSVPLAQATQRAMLVSRLGMLASRERNRSVADVPWVLSVGAIVELLLLVVLGAAAVVLCYVAAQAALEADPAWGVLATL